MPSMRPIRATRPAYRRLASTLALCASALVAAACASATTGDGSTASLGGVQLSDSVLRLRVGTEGALTARVLDARGQEVSGRRLFWSVLDSTVATVTQAGVVTARAPGSTLVSANVEGRSGVATVYVSARPVSAVRVEPATLQLVAGATASLRARALDDAGGELTGTTVTWTSSDTAVARVSAAGDVTALAPGIAIVTASVEGRSAVVAVSVSAVAVASVSLTAVRDTLVVGASTQLTLLVRDAGGAPLTNRPTAWSSDRPTVATVSSTGEVLAVAPGTATIEATVEGRSARVTLTIVPRPAAAIVVSPDASTLFVGARLRLLTLVTDASGNVLPNRPVSYASSDPSVAVVDTAGVVTALAPGSVTITASSEGKRGTATVRVLAVPVATVSIAPETPSVRVGQVVTLTATARADDGTVLAGRAVTWSSGAPGVATVGANGEVRGVAAGTALILARVEGASGTVTVRVERAPAASVTITPTSAALVVGDSTGLGATVRDASGALLGDRLPAWSSSNSAVATVSGTGMVRAVAAGSATIRATVDGVTGTATVTVSAPPATPPPPPPPAPVATVTVTPSTTSVAPGATTQLTVTLRDANGNVLTGRTVAWTTSAAAVATVSGTGVVTGVAAGSATITATSEGRSGGATVTVANAGPAAPAPVASVSVTPATLAIVEGSTGQLTATPRDANGNALTGRTVTWSTGSAAVATVSATGVVTGVSAGTATITATSEGRSGSAVVTVTAPAPAPVASVSVTPSTLSLTTGGTGQLTATPRDASGNALAGRAVAWTTSNAGVATVSASGVVTAVAPGSATITATSEGRSGSAAVTVTAPAPAIASVRVTPNNPRIEPGDRVTLTAEPLDAQGRVVSTTEAVTWSTSNPLVALVSSSGVVLGILRGDATITATVGGRSGSTTVRVRED